MTNSAILALRTDAAESRRMIDLYARENAAVLQRAGIAITNANLYMAHWLGPQGAINVLSAPPGTKLNQVLSPQAIGANAGALPLGGTVEDAIAFAQRSVGRGGPTVIPGAQHVPAQADAHVQRYRAELEKLTGARLRDIDAMRAEGEAIRLEGEAMGRTSFEAEKLRATQDLLNQLHAQGIPITDEVRNKVEQLATAYANGKVALDNITRSTGFATEQAMAFNEAWRGAARGFISDLVKGKSLTEALGNALSRLADSFLEIGLNALFGQSGSSGFGILGALFGLPKLARGGITDGPSIAGEAGREAVVPLPDGRAIPVQWRMPDGVKAIRNDRDRLHVTVGVSADANGNLLPFVESVARRQSQSAVRQGLGLYDRELSRNFGSRMVQAQARQL
jgi:hypothetical protein